MWETIEHLGAVACCSRTMMVKKYNGCMRNYDDKGPTRGNRDMNRIYSSGTVMSPELIWSMMSCAGCPSTLHATLLQVPRISFTHPLSSFARDLVFIIRAMP